MNKFVKHFLCSLIIVAILFLGGVSPVVALEDTSLSAGKVVFDNFTWSIGDKLNLSSPQLVIIPASSKKFTLPGLLDVIAEWTQGTIATFMGFRIALEPGQLAIKYEKDKYLVLDATKGLTGKISGSQDIYGLFSVKLTGKIAFHGGAYLNFIDSNASQGQGQVEFPIRLSMPLPGFGDCFAYSKATADVTYKESVITLSNLVLKNDLSSVTGEVALNLDTNQVKVSLDIYSESKRVKFLMSAASHFSGVTKLGSGHWKYEYAN